MFSHPVFFLMNCFIIAMPLAFAYLFKRRYSVQFLVAFLFFVLGTVNCILLFTRVTPFEAVDLSILRTGISIVNIYLSVIEIILCAVAILAALTGAVWLFLKLPKSERNIKKSIPAIALFSALCVGSIALFALLGVIPSSFSDKNEAYDTYGFVYCFLRSTVDRGIQEPENYSEVTIDEILSSIGNDKTVKVKEKPNIIMIQLESFMDPSYFSNVTFEKDPVPNYRALKEQGITGILSVPSVGSGTANTEFEVLCGMSLDYFGTGEYPYKTILQERNCETICYDLGELGYTSHAFHNHTGTFYNRNVVYKNLGFNTFTPIEYMNSYDANPLGWAKDYVLEDYIMEAVESTEGPDFAFAVSVQGHGKYPSEPVEGEELIKAQGIEDPLLLHQYEYFAYQLSETDDFIGRLVERLKETDEKFVLVLYGDHQPSIEYSGDDITLESKHSSEYVIWTNYGNKHGEKNLEAFQLSAFVLQNLGINNGILTKLHQNYSETVDYLAALEMLEYDMLYGDMLAYKGNNEYISPDMRMGIADIKLEKVSLINNQYYIVGEGFTQSSVLCVNGKKQSTVLISDGVLLLEDCTLQDGDKLTVHQITNDLVDLGSSNEIDFSQPFSESVQVDPSNIED
ncbi:MAG: LTA synthase family protein [Clostridia bacterium]|nr:LTA synthase family protein [Clostridia bacterium]